MRSTSSSCWPAVDPVAGPIAEGDRPSWLSSRWLTDTLFADKLFVINHSDLLTYKAPRWPKKRTVAKKENKDEMQESQW